MPIIAQAAKKLRHDKKRTQETALVRESLRNVIKAMRKSPSAKALTAAFQALDKAAKRNIIHKNKASRLKSNLAKLIVKK
jgi:small subunit ribosomal protein S20